jgi:hypothetical protein
VIRKKYDVAIQFGCDAAQNKCGISQVSCIFTELEELHGLSVLAKMIWSFLKIIS